MKYHYKVAYINANVSSSDLSNGKAGAKVAEQVEKKINSYMDQGYELYQQFQTNVFVSTGCLDGLFGGGKAPNQAIITTVFRKKVE